MGCKKRSMGIASGSTVIVTIKHAAVSLAKTSSQLKIDKTEKSPGRYLSSRFQLTRIDKSQMVQPK